MPTTCRSRPRVCPAVAATSCTGSLAACFESKITSPWACACGSANSSASRCSPCSAVKTQTGTSFAGTLRLLTPASRSRRPRSLANVLRSLAQEDFRQALHRCNVPSVVLQSSTSTPVECLTVWARERSTHMIVCDESYSLLHRRMAKHTQRYQWPPDLQCSVHSIDRSAFRLHIRVISFPLDCLTHHTSAHISSHLATCPRASYLIGTGRMQQSARVSERFPST